MDSIGHSAGSDSLIPPKPAKNSTTLRVGGGTNRHCFSLLVLAGSVVVVVETRTLVSVTIAVGHAEIGVVTLPYPGGARTMPSDPGSTHILSVIADFDILKK